MLRTSYYSRCLSTRSCACGGLFDVEILEERPGIIILKVEGKGAARVFENESGGHRWQHVPKNDKNGRVQTSTITVAVLPVPSKVDVHLDPKDLVFKTCRGSGTGGQHRNVTDSAVQLTHKPSGIQVRVESGRSQHLNKENAIELIRARIYAIKATKASGELRSSRKKQIGSGMRGDKRRTIRVRDGIVRDHVTGKSWDYKKYKRGDWD